MPKVVKELDSVEETTNCTLLIEAETDEVDVVPISVEAEVVEAVLLI